MSPLCLLLTRRYFCFMTYLKISFIQYWQKIINLKIKIKNLALSVALYYRIKNDTRCEQNFIDEIFAKEKYRYFINIV